MPGEVAGVDRGYIRGPQGFERRDVVPIVEVAAKTLEARHRRERRRDALLEHPDGGIPEVVAVRVREQLEPDVGGGGAPCDHAARILLVVIGRKVMARLDHEGVEETPSLSRDAAKEPPVGIGQRFCDTQRRGQRDPPRDERTGEPQREQRQRDAETHGLHANAHEQHRARRDRRRAEGSREGGARGAGALLGVGCGLPLEQMLV